MTDQELAAGIATGSVEALETLVSLYHGPLLRYLWQAGGSKEDAEDLATQALLRVRTDIHGYRSEGSLRAWIYRVAYRELLRHRRRQAVAMLWASKPRLEAAEGPSEDAIVIAQALAKVPADQRSAFLLTEVECLTVEEAAAVLCVPQGTVKSRCHHARLRLRKLLGSTYGETHVEPVVE